MTPLKKPMPWETAVILLILARLGGYAYFIGTRTLLAVLHSFQERFPSSLDKTAFLAHVLDIDTPVLVLVFDWPGDGELDTEWSGHVLESR